MRKVYVGYEKEPNLNYFQTLPTEIDTISELNGLRCDYGNDAYLIHNRIFEITLQVKKDSVEGNEITRRLKIFHTAVPEVKNTVMEALFMGCDRLIVDNMTIDEMREVLLDLKNHYICEGMQRKINEIKTAFKTLEIFSLED